MTSSQPVVTPNALNFTPDNKHCYAYSGTYNASTDQQTVLEFNTNSEYINAIWNLTQFVREDSVGSTESTVATISFNDSIVYQVMVGSSAIDSPTSQNVEMIIPPFTTVKVTLRSGTTAATRQATVLMRGTAYGMTETGYQ
jgi:hypothetical protein